MIKAIRVGFVSNFSYLAGVPAMVDSESKSQTGGHQLAQRCEKMIWAPGALTRTRTEGRAPTALRIASW